jgi:hypothetical protein
LVLTRLRRALVAPPQISPSPRDPVFLPDLVLLAPDQIKESRYARGRQP